MSDIEALRALAEAATPGPWERYSAGQCCELECIAGDHGSPIHDSHMDYRDAEFIAAANPTAVLGLLDRLAAAEAAVEHWKRTCVTWSEEYALIWKVRREVSEVLSDGPDTWTPYDSRDTGETFLAESVLDFTAAIRAAIDGTA